MDITAIEQLSLSCRYVVTKENRPIVGEDFLGFILIYDLAGANMRNTILEQCRKLGLDMNKCVDQGYDGSSNMSGHERGVQARMTRYYPKVRYVHCASH